jgi:hypothetical protein
MDFHGLGRPRRLRRTFVCRGYRIQFHGKTSQSPHFLYRFAEGSLAS